MVGMVGETAHGASCRGSFASSSFRKGQGKGMIGGWIPRLGLPPVRSAAAATRSTPRAQLLDMINGTRQQGFRSSPPSRPVPAAGPVPSSRPVLPVDSVPAAGAVRAATPFPQGTPSPQGAPSPRDPRSPRQELYVPRSSPVPAGARRSRSLASSRSSPDKRGARLDVESDDDDWLQRATATAAALVAPRHTVAPQRLWPSTPRSPTAWPTNIGGAVVGAALGSRASAGESDEEGLRGEDRARHGGEGGAGPAAVGQQ